ncbi:MAG TPA: hypothetical protein VJS92_08075 [Candidatus Polarisedimenticolaceae bacterium]|nr:hypothetical protein [Candidatus Polarisedimenticolaceae bacterium]
MRQLLALALLLGAGAPAAAQDGWSRVPPLPTACYFEEDGFSQRIAAAIEAVRDERGRQQGINDALAKQMGQGDPMEATRRMQEFMMKNPEQAMKRMQTIQSQGNQIQQRSAADVAASRKQDADLEALVQRYDAAVDARLGPLYARRRNLSESGGTPGEPDGSVINRQLNLE